MQKQILSKLNKACLTLLSLTLLTNCVFANEDGKLSYLDSISNSYLYGQTQQDTNLLNIASPEARAVETTLKLDSNPVITNSNAKINLSLRESDLKQVLRMLANKAKLNIVFDSSVDGKLTLDLNDVKINDAFMIIFKTSKLSYNLDGNTLTVMSLEAAKTMAYTRKNMTILPVKYVNADSLAEFLNDNIFASNIFGLSTQAIVTTNPRTNQLIVFGTNADIAAIKRVLPSLDTKPLVNNFKVNHTTPKEMAALVCDSLFLEASSGSSTQGEENDDKENEDIVLGGGVVMCEDKNSTSSSDSSSEGLKTFKTKPLTVTYFTDLGRVAVYGGSVEQAEMIKDFIKEHDKKQMMAYIEISIIELNETGSKTFANTWNLWTPFISLGFDGTSFNIGGGESPFFIWGHEYTAGVQTVNADGTTTSTNKTYTRTNNHALLYALQYAIENQNGRVLTNPKIMVTNGRKATIDMTSDYIKSVTSQVLQTSSSITSATQKTYEIGSDEGIKVEIVPFISPDGYVAMNITPEFSTIKQRVPDENGNIAATLLQRRDLELRNIRVKDGETLILAGLIKETEDQTVTKMPLLSDLPFIGAFFRKNSSTKERNEMVMVVTPHIIEGVDAQQNQNSEATHLYDL